MTEDGTTTNPYVGLRPFEREDSLYFFGRREQTAELLERLDEARFLSVVGSSGSGKSSLIRAGLVPALEGGFLVEERDRWRIAVSKPGDAPLRNFASALLTAGGGRPEAGDVAALREALEHSQSQAVADRVAPLLGDDANLLILVDQFEEIFAFRGLESEERLAELSPEERLDRARRRREAADFVNLLLEVTERRELPIYTVLTMRTDFLGECDLFYGLPEAMNRGRYLVPRLRREDLRQAIEGPPRVAGARLAPRLLDHVLNQLGDRSDRLPVLQHALSRTWEAWRAAGGSGAIDREHFEAAGTLEDALALHAEEALRNRDLDVTARVFKRLTTIDASGRRVRSPATLGELAAVSGAPRKTVEAILERFRGGGRHFVFLSEGAVPGDPRVDISHESLIRQWPRLAGWVDEERASRDRFRDLVRAAHRWKIGEAGLLRNPRLKVALKWRKGQKPTAAWAARYNQRKGDFEAAMRYLAHSQQSRAKYWAFGLAWVSAFVGTITAHFLGSDPFEDRSASLIFVYSIAVGLAVWTWPRLGRWTPVAMLGVAGILILATGTAAPDDVAGFGCVALVLSPVLLVVEIVFRPLTRRYRRWRSSRHPPGRSRSEPLPPKQELAAIRSQEDPERHAVADSAHPNPYVGLRPFGRDDSLYFFGRRDQTAELLERLYDTRFLAVVGSSGCGKSSLVRAGLVPALLGGFLVEERSRWRIAALKPGEAPLRNLAAALSAAGNGSVAAADGLLEAIDSSHTEAVVEYLNCLLDHETNLLLMVDQFEEIFSFRGRKSDEHGAEAGATGRGDRARRRAEAEDFVDLLLELAERRDLPVYTVLTMRTDFLGDCDLFYGLPEAMNRSRYLVPRLTREQLRQAITGPARLAGADLSPRLTDRLLNDLGDRTDRLPVLQHTLFRTWESWLAEGAEGAVDLAHYQRAGGLDRALSLHAEEALEKEDLDAIRRIFQCLTEIDAEQRRVRRPASLSELVAVSHADRERVEAILERFRSGGRHFVVLSGGAEPGDPRIDVAHESLLRQWDRLRQWMDDERQSRERLEELLRSARQNAAGEAGVLVDPELRLALQWRATARPTPTWAERYGCSAQDFALAMRYLDRSRRDRAAVMTLTAGLIGSPVFLLGLRGSVALIAGGTIWLLAMIWVWLRYNRDPKPG